MAGTFATYQGLPLVACVYRNARGWSSPTTMVEILASSVTGPTIEPFASESELFPVQLVRGEPAALPAVALDQEVRGGERDLGSSLFPRRLRPVGDLVVGEVSPDGTAYPHPPVRLYVIRSETVRASDGSPVERVRLTLADVRYFFANGVLKRWSFNRVLADGTVARDSLGPDGKPLSRAQVAAELAASLPGRPELAGTPGRWDDDHGPLELPPFGAAMPALAGLVARAGLEEPCLRLDGRIALHAAGDGRVAATPPDGRGENTVEIPAGLVLSKDGQGRGRVVEPGYPVETVLVVGGPRVASVAVDDWEPVLVLPDGRVFPLTSAFLRELTGKARFDIPWLQRFVLQPAAYQGDPDLDPDVAALLADQAWRMWRLPGAEVEDEPTDEAVVPAPNTNAEGETPGGAGVPDVLRQDGDGNLPSQRVRRPGRNAHLLPLLNRAETSGGRRLAPLVQCYSFAAVHVRLRGSPGDEKLTALWNEIGKLRANPPPTEFTVGNTARRGHLSVTDLLKNDAPLETLNSKAVTVEQLQRALDRVREIQSFRERPGGKFYADTLLDLTKRQIAAAEEAGGPAGASQVFEAAIHLFEAEDQIADQVAGVRSDVVSQEQLDATLAANDSIRQALLTQIRPLLKEAEAARIARADLVQTVGEAGANGKAFGLVVYGNRPVSRPGEPKVRPTDVHAQVVDAEAGIVRTSTLAGHVVADDPTIVAPSDLSHASFVPRPVRVVFGAVVRPRIDLLPGERPRTVSGVAAVQVGGGDNVIPVALTDRETLYVSAWRRTGRGAVEQIPVEAAPLERARSLREPDLVELVVLDGTSNRARLDEEARKAAAEHADVPDLVPSTRTLLARAWPINCDGVVAEVTITMRTKDNAPCGFETLVVTGSSAAPFVDPTVTRVRSPRGDAAGRVGASP